jgi:hypothetical protein
LGGTCHLLIVISEILGALVVVLFQHPPSICMSFLQRVPIRSTLSLMHYLDITTSKRAIKPLNLERLQKEATRRREEQLHQKNTKRENDLALSVDVRSLGQKNRSGCLLGTSLSLSLARTSRVDRVNLYDLNRNDIGLSSS